MDREVLLRDAMRLEDKAPDGSKGLWLVSWQNPRSGHPGFQDSIVIVEALTAPGARAVLETLELAVPEMDLKFVGPVNRLAWPRDQIPWYEWLNEDDERLVTFFDVAGVGAALAKNDPGTSGDEDPS
jgi:hypothetical protein